MTESVWNVSFNVMLNCSCFQTAISVVSLVRMLFFVGYSRHVLPPDEGVVVMAADWQRELSVAGAR